MTLISKLLLRLTLIPLMVAAMLFARPQGRVGTRPPPLVERKPNAQMR